MATTHSSAAAANGAIPPFLHNVFLKHNYTAGDRKFYTTADSPVSLVIADSGIDLFITGTCTLNLPAISSVGAGVTYRFVATGGDYTITVDPNAADKIVAGNKTAGVDGGALTWVTNMRGESFEITSGTDWNVQHVMASSWLVATA